MKYTVLIILFALGFNSNHSFHDFEIKMLDKPDKISFSAFKGKKVLIVNVASKCGYTTQYADLQKLYEAHKEKLVVIGMPCNQFMGQEPGSEKEIAAFCSKNYGVTFPMSEKVNVKGNGQHEIYKWLTQKYLNGLGDFKVSWNFNKFLINEEGKLIAHFPSSVSPLDSQITDLL